MDDLYKEEILEASLHPRNFTENKIKGCFIKNPLCGDEIFLEINLSPQNSVMSVSFGGSMCALSKASASFFTEYSKGKKMDDLLRLSEDDFWEIVHMPKNLMRKNCIFLIKEAYTLYARTQKPYNTKTE
jgi:NifU-like protein involved in Fe-S cluster formation